MLAGNLYDHDQLPQLFISVLKKLSPKGNDLREKLRKCKGFRAVLKKINAERDEESAAHLKRDVYTLCRNTCRTGPIKIVRHEKRQQGKRCTCMHTNVYTS